MSNGQTLFLPRVSAFQQGTCQHRYFAGWWKLKEGSSEYGAGGGSVREALAAASFPRLSSVRALGRRRVWILILGGEDRWERIGLSRQTAHVSCQGSRVALGFRYPRGSHVLGQLLCLLWHCPHLHLQALTCTPVIHVTWLWIVSRTESFLLLPA